jgi:transcription termination factor NusB
VCLLLGTYEIMTDTAPKNVIINEWLEICKVYSPDDSHKLVNAVLENVFEAKNKSVKK